MMKLGKALIVLTGIFVAFSKASLVMTSAQRTLGRSYRNQSCTQTILCCPTICMQKRALLGNNGAWCWVVVDPEYGD